MKYTYVWKVYQANQKDQAMSRLKTVTPPTWLRSDKKSFWRMLNGLKDQEFLIS